MKIKIMTLICLTGIVILSMGAGLHKGDSQADKYSLKIGVVSIKRIFQNCKRIAKYRQDALAERDQLVAELDKLSKEIVAEEAGLRTFKVGSSDYMLRMKEVLEKQAKLRAQEEFHKQQMMLRERKMTGELYKDILRITSNIAEQKELAMVFERSEPEFPAATSDELAMTISTHKLLYSGSCLDITDEVIIQLDANN